MDAEVAPAAVPEGRDPAGHSFTVQLVAHTSRLTGQVTAPAIPQRLTDFLNNHEGNILVLEHGQVEDLVAGDPPQAFEVAQVRLDTVLFVAPRGGLPNAGDPFERVVKTPVAATVLLPGLALAGNVFVLPGTPLAQAPLGGRRFAPLADATITPAGNPARAWREPIVAFNIAQALVYAAD